MKPKFFATPALFRTWLEKNHETSKELWVGFYKKSTGKPSITWSESVDQALCFGWIDGIRKSFDENSYVVRFTPRRPNSRWSAINIQKVKVFQKLGLMRPAGLKLFEERKHAEGYSYEQFQAKTLPPKYEKQFRKNREAWAFYERQAPSYRRLCNHWVTSAKQEETRQRRLDKLIAISAKGARLI